MKRKICVVTGTRAEYGLLRNLIRLIDENDSMHLQLIVTVMHLSQKYGFTYKQIEKDGFSIEKKIEIKKPKREKELPRILQSITDNELKQNQESIMDEMFPG